MASKKGLPGVAAFSLDEAGLQAEPGQTAAEKKAKRKYTKQEIQRMIVAIAGEEGMDPDLALKVAETESQFNPDAVSPKGAVGVFQLMEAAAAEQGISAEERRDPSKNIRAGVGYLKRMIAKHGGNVELGLASYNAGPGAVDKAGGVPQFTETQKYTKGILDSLKQRTGLATTSAPGAESMQGPQDEAPVQLPYGAVQDVQGQGEEVRVSTFGTPEEALAAEEALDKARSEDEVTASQEGGVKESTDPFVKELIARIMADSPPGEQAKPLSNGMRFAAGIIAATDPDAYVKIVQPELERRNEDARFRTALAETARTKDISALQALVSLGERDEVARQRLDIQREGLEIRKASDAAKAEQKARQLESAEQTVKVFESELNNVAGEMIPLIEQLSGSGDPTHQARGEALARELAGVEGIIRSFSKDPFKVVPETVPLLERQIAALRRSQARAFQAVDAEARAERAVHAKVSQKLTGERTGITVLMSQVAQARKQVEAGVGGLETSFTPNFIPGMGGGERQAQDAMYSDINLSISPDRLGLNLTEGEQRILKGILLSTYDDKGKQLSALSQIEAIYKRRLKEIDSIFRSVGVMGPSPLGYAQEHVGLDDIPEGAEPVGFFGTQNGPQVIRMGPSPYDMYVVEEEY